MAGSFDVTSDDMAKNVAYVVRQGKGFNMRDFRDGAGDKTKARDNLLNGARITMMLMQHQAVSHVLDKIDDEPVNIYSPTVEAMAFWEAHSGKGLTDDAIWEQWKTLHPRQGA